MQKQYQLGSLYLEYFPCMTAQEMADPTVQQTIVEYLNEYQAIKQEPVTIPVDAYRQIQGRINREMDRGLCCHPTISDSASMNDYARLQKIICTLLPPKTANTQNERVMVRINVVKFLMCHVLNAPSTTIADFLQILHRIDQTLPRLLPVKFDDDLLTEVGNLLYGELLPYKASAIGITKELGPMATAKKNPTYYTTTLCTLYQAILTMKQWLTGEAAYGKGNEGDVLGLLHSALTLYMDAMSIPDEKVSPVSHTFLRIYLSRVLSKGVVDQLFRESEDLKNNIAEAKKENKAKNTEKWFDNVNKAVDKHVAESIYEDVDNRIQEEDSMLKAFTSILFNVTESTPIPEDLESESGEYVNRIPIGVLQEAISNGHLRIIGEAMVHHTNNEFRINYKLLDESTNRAETLQYVSHDPSSLYAIKEGVGLEKVFDSKDALKYHYEFIM